MRSGPPPQPKPVAPQRPPHVPHTQAAYAGASSGNPTSASLPLALDSFIPPLGLVDPAAPHLLPQPQEAAEPPAQRHKQEQLCSGCGYSTAGHARAKKGPNCLKNCRCRWVVQEAVVAQARRRQAWHSLPVRAGGGRRRTS